MTQAQETSPQTGSRGDRAGAQIWIIGALEMISSDGIDAIKVERLARNIGVSKGSFYWFFSNIEDLLSRTLKHWKRNLNDAVLAEVRQAQGSAEDRISNLIDLVFQSKLGRFDAAIRAWALKDARVLRVVEAVDADRLELLKEVFLQSALPPRMAQNRAHLLYRAIIAESYLSLYPGSSSKAEYLKELLADFLRPDEKMHL